MGKFFTSEIEVEQIINETEEAIYNLGETEVLSSAIGDIVLDILAKKNEIAYVRFASVYRDFKTLDEFENILAARRRQNKSQG